ncbi:uncharacterized protein LACBIDRAFT_297711 [Laccaria bicolor S238N-H82]|uniref:Predicted protein n=1 Tax=Laccaria bicolor (strain S238N-H82 / ATCC MYA-4686) TaxID=486041 RepID=B0DBU4_LACBS|nr:uncharacterized protein LACBIDRAFT_297711 [Laccaria bicolor S238N-H82]EDR08244.1 predicted protein [Laccaria bicolor S238N-H82]|eukprot:XP_001881314.1 predicted protein [Laccaria bicolor S238N-H82]
MSDKMIPDLLLARQEMLDRLEDLSIKGFLEADDSPSSGTASLPTPESGHAAFVPPITVEEHSFDPQVLWYEDDDQQIKAPGAPLMKDLDSFTEGTGQGSFDSIPAASTDEHGQPIFVPHSFLLALLPPSDTLVETIETWRENVLDDTSRPIKRRRSRSFGRDSNSGPERRIRRRTQSLPSFWERDPSIIIGTSYTRSEPDPPD